MTSDQPRNIPLRICLTREEHDVFEAVGKKRGAGVVEVIENVIAQSVTLAKVAQRLDEEDELGRRT